MAEAVTEREVAHYSKFYGDYTKASLLKVLKAVKRRFGKLDAITVDHYMKPKSYGGLGKGKLKR